MTKNEQKEHKQRSAQGDAFHKKNWREVTGCPELVADLRRLHAHPGDTGYTAQMVERIKYHLCID